jgi:hypothetical protein
MTDSTPAASAAPVPSVPVAAVAVPKRSSRRRRGLSLVALVLACLTIMLSTLAVWTHQVALNTDRFTALVANVIGDPALIPPISSRVSTQVVEALDVQTRVADALPGPSKVLAPAIANAVREAIDKRLQVALANPKVQQGLLAAISFTHERVVRLLRDQGVATDVVDGYVYLNVFSVVGIALAQLQEMGIIPASVTLPDLSSPDAPQVLADRLQTALGITLPADFGTIKLMPADKLVTARTVVKAFDLIVVVLVVLSIVLVLLALWLANDRRKMFLALAIGTIIAFLFARLAMNGARDFLISGVQDGDLAAAMRAVLDATLADLRSLTFLVVIATIILAIIAYAAGRPAWLTRTAAAASGAATGAASGAASGASTLAASASSAAPSGESLAATARTHRAHIERAGLVAIAFVVLWLAVGPEVALLGLVLVVGWEMVVGLLARGSDDDAADPTGASGDGPTASS